MTQKKRIYSAEFKARVAPAQKRWRKIQGFDLLSLVANNVKFVDGVIDPSQNRSAA